jgi:AcrR family transcriptional regulator
MRVRTEEKRLEIVRIATELFEQNGFDRTSMSMISEKVGGSKATLYGYFSSKEELLQAVLSYDVTQEAERLMNELLSGKDLRDGLIRLGIEYMTRRLSNIPISNVRMVATQPSDSTIGKVFFETVLEPAWQRLARRFERLMDEGVLNRAEPWVAAMHWKGLNEWDMFEKRLLGAITEGDPKTIRKASTLAADAFLKLYGTEAGRPKAGKAQARMRKASVGRQKSAATVIE